MATRTFLAVPLDERVVAGLAKAQQVLSGTGTRMRWVARENLHLTVKFLGDVADADLADVCRVASEIAAEIDPHEFVVRGLTAIPPSGQLRMVWANVVEPTGQLEALASLAEDSYGAMGFKRENRRFRPHLTLGRVKSGHNVAALREAVADFAGTDFGATRAEKLIVFGSRLTPAGPIYTPLATAAVGPGQ